MHSEETKAKIRAANLGKKRSPETRKRISDAAKARKTNSFKGRKHTLESINKMRLAKLGDKNPNYKGDNIDPETSRIRLQKKNHLPKGLEHHHVDGNPLNNNPANIITVTRRKHMEVDGRLEKLIRRNKKRS